MQTTCICQDICHRDPVVAGSGDLFRFSTISTEVTVTGVTGVEDSPFADCFVGAVAIASTTSIPL